MAFVPMALARMALVPVLLVLIALAQPTAAGPLGAGAATPPPPRPVGLGTPDKTTPGAPISDAPSTAAPAAPLPAPPAAASGQAAPTPSQAPDEAGAALRSAPTRTAVQPAAPPVVAAQKGPQRGPITNLPLPRYVSLKTTEGNARRGPGVTHRIDWVFTRPGMPLRITAEFENWRRVEDAEGAGGWVHYSLLSGIRSVLVRANGAALRRDPGADGTLIARLEAGVVARLLACGPTQCRVQVEGWRGWVEKGLLWGVDPEEVFE